MNNLRLIRDQKIIKFEYDQNFKKDDFYISSSNQHIIKILNNWPKWEKNFLNISGDKYSGKTHLINIFLEKCLLSGIYLNIYHHLYSKNFFPI